jgi:hypothetical protein
MVEAIRVGMSWRGAIGSLGGVVLGGILGFAAIHVKGPGTSEYDGVVFVLGAAAIGVLGASGAIIADLWNPARDSAGKGPPR